MLDELLEVEIDDDDCDDDEAEIDEDDAEIDEDDVEPLDQLDDEDEDDRSSIDSTCSRSPLRGPGNCRSPV